MMPLVPLVPASAAADVDRAAIDSGVEQYGQLLHTWGALLNRPGLFSVYLPFLRAVAGPGTVDAQIKDLSALLVGNLNGCRYTVSHRYAAAKRGGASDDLVDAVLSKDWSDLGPEMQLALELTHTMTVAPAVLAYDTQPQIATLKVLKTARKLFTPEQLVELTMSISIWNALSRFHRVMGLPLDMPAGPSGLEPL